MYAWHYLKLVNLSIMSTLLCRYIRRTERDDIVSKLPVKLREQHGYNVHYSGISSNHNYSDVCRLRSRIFRRLRLRFYTGEFGMCAADSRKMWPVKSWIRQKFPKLLFQKQSSRRKMFGVATKRFGKFVSWNFCLQPNCIAVSKTSETRCWCTLSVTYKVRCIRLKAAHRMNIFDVALRFVLRVE